MVEYYLDMIEKKARFLPEAPNKECHSSEVINRYTAGMQVLGQSHKLGLLGAIPSPASKQISVW